MSIYTDGSYRRLHPTWHAEDAEWKAAQVSRILRSWACLEEDVASICDVGCGSGDVLLALESRLPKCHYFMGFDPSQDAIKSAKAKQCLKTHFTWELSVLSQSQHFSLVLFLDVLEHMDNPRAMLRLVHKRCSYVVAIVPLDVSVQSILRAGRLTHAHDRDGHLHFYTEETARHLFTDTGYTILRCTYISPYLDLAVHSWRAKLMRWPRRILFWLWPALAVRLLGGFSLLVLARTW